MIKNNKAQCRIEMGTGDVRMTASDQKSVLVLIESLMTSYIMAEYGTYPGEGSIPYDNKLNLLHKFIYKLYGLSDESYKGGDSDEN